MSPKASNGGKASPLAPASSQGAAGSSATPLNGAGPRNAPGWSKISLREAGVILIDCDHRTPESSPTGYPYVMIPQIKGGVIDFSGAKLISPKDFAEWTRKAYPSEHDIVLSRRCNPGETAYVPAGTKFALGQNLVLLRAQGEKISPSFLRWLVRGPEWWELVGRYINVGAVFESLRCADIPKFVLRIPPISVQKSIAHILGTLDDKIELNRRINQTLEEMAQALFKSWFVDFDPVKAKASVLEAGGTPQQAEQAAMQSISGKSSDELEFFKAAQPEAYAKLIHTASLFPSRLTESELGPIPEGWEVAKLNQVCSYLARGIGPSYCEQGEGAVRVLNQKCIRDGRVDLTPSRMHDSTKRSIQGRELYALDILVNSTGQGTLGRTAQIGEPDSVTVVDSHVTVLRPDASKISKLYLGINIRLREQEIESMAEGSTGQTELSRLRLGELNILLPGLKLLRAFDSSIEPMFYQKMELAKERVRLAECRDSILPKLLSGELEIPDELLAEVSA